MISVKCVKCGQVSSVPDSLAGKTAVCAQCGNVNAVGQAGAPPGQAGAPPGEPPAPPPAGPPPAAIETDPNARTWGMLCHLSALSGFIGVPFGTILGPLIIWLIKGKEHPFIDANGKEALNFQITMAIAAIVSGILVFAIVGIFLLIAVAVVDVVFVILAAIRTNSGERFTYPSWTLRLVK